jgi:hypothetical protein
LHVVGRCLVGEAPTLGFKVGLAHYGTVLMQSYAVHSRAPPSREHDIWRVLIKACFNLALAVVLAKRRP